MSRLFPELEATDKGASVGGEGGQSEAVQGGRPTSSVDPRRLFERMLGLSRSARAPLAWGIEQVSIAGPGRLTLLFVAPSQPAVTVYLVAPARIDAFASAKAFSLVPAPGVLPQALGVLLRRGARRMHEVPFEPLERMAAAAQGGGEGGDRPGVGGAPGGDDANAYARSIVHTYAGDRWASFFEGHEMYRGYCQRQRGAIASVHHTEIECYYSNPPAPDDAQGFFNYPARAPEAGGSAGAFELLTDLGDLDVIRGGAAKLDRVLDGLARRHEAPELVMLQPGCTTLVTGDDLERSAELLRRKLRVPVLNLALVPDPLRESIRLARGQPGFFEGQPTPGAVNLVGLPRMPGSDEIVRMIEAMGLTVNAWVFPDVELASIRRFGAGEVAVLYGWAWNEPAYTELLEGTRCRVVRPPSPFGVEGTRRFLLEVARATGREAAFERVWGEVHGAAREALEGARREASGYRLGFVGDEGELVGMLSSERLLGVPVVELVESLGFGVDWLVRPGRRSVAADALWQASGRRVRWFETPDELHAELREGEAVAYYTELAFDTRLSRAGKGAFSLRDVALGVGGALSTVRRLLATCRLPFYRVYGHLLREVEHG